MVGAQAIIAREPEQHSTPNWSLEEIGVHDPGDGEVLVEVYASGICHTDIVLTSVPDGILGMNYPKIAGHEGAGIVRTVGKNVQSIDPGDPVLLSFDSCSSCSQCHGSHPAYCDEFAKANYIGRQQRVSLREGDEAPWTKFFGQSSFAQYSVVSQATIVNVKNLLHHQNELKLFAPLGCGFQTGMGAVLNTADARATDIVMVLGLGAVGMGAVMTSRIRGCRAIVAVDRVRERLDIARTLGATHTIDNTSPDFTSLDEAARAYFPVGVSVVLDTTGAPVLIEQGLLSTHARGKLVCIGIPPLEYELGVNLVEHINKGRSVLGCIEGDCVPQQAIPQMIQWYRDGVFPIDKVVKYFNGTDYQRALEALKDGTAIKPVLVWREHETPCNLSLSE